MPFLAVLQIILVVLKAANLVAWSWWLIFVPSYLWLLSIAFVFFLAIASVFCSYMANR